MKVCKFGGTSMATAESIKQVKSILDADAERKFVVVSAPGKRFSGDVKVTDMLYAAYRQKCEEGKVSGALDSIRNRFQGLVDDLGVDLDLTPYMKEIEEGINVSENADYAASRGEYLSAVITAKFLGYRFVDAGDVVKFKFDGTFDQDMTNDLVAHTIAGERNGVVVPGFYGRLPDKKIKTFSRGGSDVTGAILARGVKASVYENWTDVNGFMITDPRVVKNPKHIAALTYEELRELSYMGAGVLHPDSIFPVKYDQIPINIRNTFEPENPGTYILADTEGYDLPVITGIAGRKGNSTIVLKKSMMNAELGFGRKVLSVLERYGLSFEHMPTGIDTMSLVLNAMDEITEKKILESIRGMVNPDTIEVTHSLALIAVVGQGMANQQGTAAKIFTALFHAGVNVRMIDQGSSEMNIIVGVEEKDYTVAINAIYQAFFGVKE